MRTVFKGWVKLFRNSVTQPWFKTPAARDVYSLLLVMADADGIIMPNAAEMATMLGKARKHYVLQGIATLVEHGVVERLSKPHRPLKLRLVKSDENVPLQSDENVPLRGTKTYLKSDENVPLTPYNIDKNLVRIPPYPPKGDCGGGEKQQDVVGELMEDNCRATREQLCMAYGISEDTLAQLLKEIAAEWEATNEADRSRRHLINTLRKKATTYATTNKTDRRNFKPADIRTGWKPSLKVITSPRDEKPSR